MQDVDKDISIQKDNEEKINDELEECKSTVNVLLEPQPGTYFVLDYDNPKKKVDLF